MHIFAVSLHIFTIDMCFNVCNQYIFSAPLQFFLSVTLLPCCVLCCFVPLCSSWHRWRSPRLALCTRLLMLCRYLRREGRGKQRKEWIEEDSEHIKDRGEYSKRRGEGEQERIWRERNEMYHWLNYPRTLNNWILSFLPPRVVYGAVSGTLQWPFDPGWPGEPVEQPTRGAVHPLLLRGQSRRLPQMGWHASAGRDPLAAPAEGGSGQSEAGRAGPVTEGMEQRLLWAETGSDWVHEWTGLLVVRQKDWCHPS